MKRLFFFYYFIVLLFPLSLCAKPVTYIWDMSELVALAGKPNSQEYKDLPITRASPSIGGQTLRTPTALTSLKTASSTPSTRSMTIRDSSNSRTTSSHAAKPSSSLANHATTTTSADSSTHGSSTPKRA